MNKQSTPNGPTQLKWFQVGYQQALQDIKRALEDGDREAAEEWIKNNSVRLY